MGRILTVEKAGESIRLGRVVAYPTETFWGLAADPLNAEAVEELVVLKSRPPEKGIPLIAETSASALRLARLDPEVVSAISLLTDRFWPGPLTLVFSPSDWALKSLSSRVYAPDGSIAVRVSSGDLARKLAKCASGLITSTSANPAEAEPPRCPAEVTGYFPELDYVCEKTEDVVSGEQVLPSTILDVRQRPFRVLRLGAISNSEIKILLGEDLL